MGVSGGSEAHALVSAVNLFRIGIGLELARSCELMNLTVLLSLLLTSCLPLALFAEGGSTGDDPFGAYERSFDNELSAILERGQSPVRQVVQERTRVDENIVISNGNQTEINTFAKRFWGGREDQLVAALDRLERLRPTLEPILDSEGIPRQFLAVALIESGAQPTAMSPRQARGLWQLVPSTAREYGLSVSQEKDERTSVEASTRAAAQYLRDLHKRFGNWPLALAAYNAGEGSVGTALATAGVSTFWQLSAAALLPQETRNYVPAVLAAIHLLSPEQPQIAIHHESRPLHWVYALSREVN